KPVVLGGDVGQRPLARELERRDPVRLVLLHGLRHRRGSLGITLRQPCRPPPTPSATRTCATTTSRPSTTTRSGGSTTTRSARRRWPASCARRLGRECCPRAGSAARSRSGPAPATSPST